MKAGHMFEENRHVGNHRMSHSKDHGVAGWLGDGNATPRRTARMVLAVLAGLLPPLACDATTYYLKTNMTTDGNTAFRDASYWVDSNGTASGDAGAALDPDADYVMTNNLRQTRTAANAHFGGKSLRIGSSSVGPYLSYYYNEGTSFDKLYLTRGYFVGNRGHGITYNLDANIEVDAPDGNPFCMTLSYTNCMYSITGSLSSGVGNRIVLCTISPCYKVAKQADYGVAADESWHTFNFSTDMSGFLGTLELGRTTGEYHAATPKMWQIKARFPSTMSVPGSIVVPAFDVLAVGKQAVLTVGNLTLSAGSMLECEEDVSEFGSVAVTGSLSMTGPVMVHAKGGVLPYAGGTCTLLSAPDTAENAFSESDFILVETCGGSKVSLSVVTDGTTRRLVASWSRWLSDDVVTMIKSDSTSKEHKASVAGCFDSALTNAASWSNAKIPMSGYDYFVSDGKALRTRDDLSSDTFAGDLLAIGPSSCLFVMTPSYTVPNLTLINGSILAAPNTGSFTLNGDLCAPSGSVRLRQYVKRYIHVAAKVTGEAELVLEGWSNTSSPLGYYDFKAADMSGFKGAIRVTEHPSMARPDYISINQTLAVDSNAGEIQLGGKLDAFNPKALTLERCATLALTAGNRLNITTNYNRGIFVNGDGRITAQNAWHVLAISTRLTVNGTLVKDGSGPLVLGGECVAEGDNPTLDIWTSNVVVAAAGSVNGLKVKFAAGTRLGLKVNLANEELTRYGIRNTATDTPFELPDGTTELPLEIDASGTAQPDGELELGIVTVSSSAAQDVEDMLPASAFMSPFPRMSAVKVRKTDPVTGDVTFAVRLCPRGSQFILR